MAFPSRILAVDLGGTAVRVLELGPDARGGPTVLAASEEEIPYDPAKSSEFFPVYAQALTTALGKIPSRTRIAHLCIGGPAVFARILKVPAADPAKVDSMVGFEAQQTVPAIEQAVWGYQLLPSPQTGEVEALVLAIKKEAVDEMAAAASAAGLKVQSLTLAPAALLNSFAFNYPEAAGSTLILDIGARATTILLFEETRIFVRVVPLGGASVSQAVAADLQESFSGAELLKRAKGFVHPGGAYEDAADPAAERISKLSRGVMTRLYGEVERSTAFFRSQQGGAKPGRVLLAGGGALLGYTELFFREKLKVPVEFFQPFRRISFPAPPPAILKNFPAWAAAVGTGLQAVPEIPVRMNVLEVPGRAQVAREKERPARVWAGVWAALLLLLPALHLFWSAEKTRHLVQTETQKVEEAARSLAELQAETQKFQAVADNLAEALQLQQERLRWPRLLQELKKQSQTKLWITGLKILPEGPATKDPKPPAGKPQADGAPVVEIRGMFETQSEKADADAVEKFVQALQGGGVLRNVVVREREVPKYVEGKTDQVALKFRLQAEWPRESSAPPSGKGEAR